MNTLSRETTARFFRTEAGFTELRKRWSVLVSEDKPLGPAHHLLYAILRGKDWRRGFAPCTNRRKLDNGIRRWTGATRAIVALHNAAREEANLAPFDGLLAEDALAVIHTLVPLGEGYCWEADLDSMPAYASRGQLCEDAGHV